MELCGPKDKTKTRRLYKENKNKLKKLRGKAKYEGETKKR